MQEEVNEEKVTFDWKNISYVVVGVIILGALGFFFLSRPEKSNSINPSSQNEISISTNEESEEGGDSMEITELQIQDIIVGDGAEAVEGANISVHYSGTLTDGTKFDSSYDRGTPFEFILGAGEVIEGWDKGFAGMKVGGKRKLTIPSNMAYGERAVGDIPANSTLIFEVELLEVK